MRSALIALCALPASRIPLPAQDIDDGRDSLRAGKYQAAITILLKIPATDSQWIAAQRELTRAYATIGKYDEAENTARRGTAAKGGAQLWNTLGEVALIEGEAELSVLEHVIGARFVISSACGLVHGVGASWRMRRAVASL
jgi:predicted Zn-dependent protease